MWARAPLVGVAELVDGPPCEVDAPRDQRRRNQLALALRAPARSQATRRPWSRINANKLKVNEEGERNEERRLDLDDERENYSLGASCNSLASKRAPKRRRKKNGNKKTKEGSQSRQPPFRVGCDNP